MTPLWTLEAIAAATDGTACGRADISGVEFDSRTVTPGALFVALPGEATDGHAFIGKAFDNGAAAVLISDASWLDRPDRPHVLVTETAHALEALGAAARVRASAAVRLGVTGSAGKTSTKEGLRQALERFRPGQVHASVLSYNNHVGVPLTLARMPAEALFGVFEMGMNHAGELTALAAQVKPHVAIITNVGTAHLEHLGSEEAIADAKAEIFTGVEPGGTAIIPFDTRHQARLLNHARAAGIDKALTFSMTDAQADAHVVRLAESAACTALTANLCGELLTFKIGQPGAHWVSNALAILLAVKAAGGDLGLAGLALAEMQPLKGRGRRTLVAARNGKAVLIDESYNANPASMRAALAVLGGIRRERQGRRIAVLGEMRELGPDAPALHADLAEPVSMAGVDVAVLVGAAMKALGSALQGRVETEYYADTPRALERLQGLLRADDVVLVKGSNGVGLSRLVDALTERGDDA